MIDFILKYWLQWAFGIAAGIITAAVKNLWKRQKAVERGIQALLRDRILQAYYHYKERDWITLHGLQNVTAMYEEYHNLGGNGTVTKLVADLKELDVRDG